MMHLGDLKLYQLILTWDNVRDVPIKAQISYAKRPFKFPKIIKQEATNSQISLSNLDTELIPTPHFNQNTINTKYFPEERKWVFLDESGGVYEYQVDSGALRRFEANTLKDYQ